MNAAVQQSSGDPTAMRPFRVNVPESELADLRRRIKATRWADKETVADFSQGVQLAFIQALARYWATDYDWRKVEAKLNSYPNFLTEIDGLDIHFNELTKGGHFAAWEQPKLFTEELRAGLRSLRR